ncbi:glycosyltransferase [Microbacterium sp. JZ37]|uniref:glycosyltransferase n=1 Tax=Microbacterium sp. JZ37 TaxID=2654193 RepID=UPI002B474881|nr:glycosyltransferase [Microbacterium sp. JZ37]
MRKVVVFRSNLLPASETFVRNQADALENWQPTLMGLRRTDSPVSRHTDVIIEPRTKLHSRLHSLTGRSHRLSSFIQQSRAEVVHAHFATDAWLVVKAARAAGVPLVVTVHARDVTAALNQGSVLKRLIMRRRVKYALSHADLVVTVSDYITRHALTAGAKAERTVRLYTGTPIPEDRSTRKEWDIVFVGRLVEKKGIDDLLEALAIIDSPGIRVAIVGDGPLKSMLVERARTLSAQIRFLGMIRPQAVLETIAASRVLAAPSKTTRDGDIEGLPTVIIEALALGVPVVATRHSGIPEAVVDGVNGRLVDERDVVALASAISALVDDEAEAARCGARARETAISAFDIQRQTAQLELLYDKVARSNLRGSRAG